MAATSYKRMKDLQTDEDIYRVLNIEDESDVFYEESDNFWFDTSEEDSEGDSDTSSIVHESEPYEEVSYFSQPFVPHDVARPRIAFLSVSGVNVDFDDEISVLECFQKFIDEDMWQLFAEQTNIWANQFLAANPNLKPRSRARSWMDTNLTEMKTLTGLLVFQGFAQKRKNGMYFSKRESIVTPHFSQIMTEKRFHLLIKFLHFADSSKFDPDQHHKKLYKIQPILDHLKSKFSSVYTPEGNICIDESLLLWKG